jgi:hypothetical protein
MTIPIGVVHFAGTTKGDGLYFCQYPLQFPILFTAALPFYFSVLFSLNSSCPDFSRLFPKVNSQCAPAMIMLSEELNRSNLHVNFSPGRSPFLWPPKLV